MKKISFETTKEKDVHVFYTFTDQYQYTTLLFIKKVNFTLRTEKMRDIAETTISIKQGKKIKTSSVDVQLDTTPIEMQKRNS